MSREREERIVAFLEGALGDPERRDFLDALEADPALALDVRHAARGLEAIESLTESRALAEGSPPGRPRALSPWWALAAAAATLVVAVPTTLWVSRGPVASNAEVGGRPVDSEPSFVLVLHGRWPDAGTIDGDESARRAEEYWSWASTLAQGDVLLAAGDLRWEPGRRLGPEGTVVGVSDDEVDASSFVVGMFAVRVGSYDEAMTLARDCPHLSYGGSVSVRRVASGFVSDAGRGDWGS